MDRKQLVAYKIKQARLEAGLTQEELGKLFGRTDVTISKIERVMANVSFDELETLAAILGKPVEWFIDDKVELSPRPISALLTEAAKRLEQLEIVKIPVIGSVPAGTPFIEEQVKAEDFVQVIREELKAALNPDGVFALRIEGDSLIGDDIHSGDFALVDPTKEIINGKIYVVRIGNEVVVRHVTVLDGKVRLSSSNGKFPEMEISEIEILGRVFLSVSRRSH